MEQKQRAITGSIAANKIDSVDHGRERVHAVKVYLDKDISILLSAQDIKKGTRKDGRIEGCLTSSAEEVSQRRLF